MTNKNLLGALFLTFLPFYGFAQTKVVPTGDCFEQFLAAIDRSDLDALDRLVQRGCDINVQGQRNDEGRFTPLTWAVHQKNLRAVKRLLAMHARVNFPEYDAFFLPPLLWVLTSKDAAIAEALLRAGASPTLVFSAEENPDCWICYEDITYLHAVYDLIDRKDTAFAVQKLLIRFGADVNAKRPSTGATPLDYAASEGYLPYMDFLIRNGAVLYDKDRAAIVEAAERSLVDAVAFLAQKGVSKYWATRALMACIDCCGDGFGESITPENRVKTAEILLKSGAGVHLKVYDIHQGDTLAIQNSRMLLFRPSVAEMLVRKKYLDWPEIQTPEPEKTSLKATVTAPSGLRLRSFPSTQAPVLATIPNGESLLSGYAGFGVEMTVEGRKGMWKYVDWKGKRGFVFEGFLVFAKQ